MEARDGGGSKKTREVSTLVLPSDIIFFKVLTRLPVKSLLRFKSVSKSWYSTISHKSFAKAHLTFSQTHPSLCIGSAMSRFYNKILLSANDKEEEDQGLANFIGHLPNRRKIRYVSESLNGLICLVFKDYTVKLCNPSTKELTAELPPIVDTPHSHSHSSSSNTRRFYSFGFDPVTDTYKILSSLDDYKAGIVEHRVYTLGSGLWRPIRGDGGGCVQHCIPLSETTERICLNGVIYFLTRTRDGTSMMVSFDVGEEKFCVIPLPPEGARSRFQFLFQWSGCPAISLFFDNIIRMWILKEKVWIEDSIVLPSSLDGKLFWFLGIIHTGEVLLVTEDSISNSHTFCYHPERQIVRRVEISTLPKEIGFFGFFFPDLKISTHTESLLSLSNIN